MLCKEYNVNVVLEQEMKSMSLAYVLGFATGIGVVAVMGIIINHLYKKKFGRKKNEYDERQEALRGKAYKAAFFTLMGYLAINGIICQGFGIEWAESFTEAFIGICISVIIFAIICIKDDAYFSISEKPGTYLILFAVIGLLNIGICLFNFIKHESFITDGLLNEKAVNLSSGIMFFILDIVLVVKMLDDKISGKREGDI